MIYLLFAIPKISIRFADLPAGKAGSHHKRRSRRGFTMVEMVVTMGIVGILLAFLSPNLIGIKHKASLDETAVTLISDIKLQQTKAMIGDTEGRATTDLYGIYFDAGQSRYVLFHGSPYSAVSPDNYAVALGDQISFSSVTFSSSQVIFQKGDGEVSGYAGNSNSVTLRNIQTGQQKTITVNRRGVVTNVN